MPTVLLTPTNTRFYDELRPRSRRTGPTRRRMRRVFDINSVTGLGSERRARGPERAELAVDLLQDLRSRTPARLDLAARRHPRRPSNKATRARRSARTTRSASAAPHNWNGIMLGPDRADPDQRLLPLDWFRWYARRRVGQAERLRPDHQADRRLRSSASVLSIIVLEPTRWARRAWAGSLVPVFLRRSPA